jgi:hypothetical protein
VNHADTVVREKQSRRGFILIHDAADASLIRNCAGGRPSSALFLSAAFLATAFFLAALAFAATFFAALLSAFFRGTLLGLFAATAARLLAATARFVHGRPRPTFCLLITCTTLLVSFLDVFRFPFLFAGVLLL